MPYKIEYLEKVVRHDIPRLSKPEKARIKRVIEDRLTSNPIAFGKPLQYGLSGQRRLRVGNYRIIYRIDHEQHIVTIDTIWHRNHVYD